MPILRLTCFSFFHLDLKCNEINIIVFDKNQIHMLNDAFSPHSKWCIHNVTVIHTVLAEVLQT